MTLQTNLFDTPPLPPTHTFKYAAKILHARRSDPVSSKLAAADVEDNEYYAKLKTKIYLALKDNPFSTASELGKVVGDYDNTHKRLPDLEREGKVSKVRNDKLEIIKRQCTVTKRLCCQWMAL